MADFVPVPTGYRMIASGDVVPWFDPNSPGRWLLFREDGTVTWTDTPPEEGE